MKIRSTFLLLFLVVVAALLAFLLSGKPSRRERAGGNSLELLPGFKANTVQSITVERPGQPRIVCQRQDGGWQMTEPVRAHADGKRLDRILSDLRSARTVATFALPDPAAAAPYGLVPPRYSLTLSGSAGARKLRYTVRFGSAMPIGSLTYAAVAGRHQAVAVRSKLADDADIAAADLRSNILVPGLDPAALQAIAISARPLDKQPALSLECRRSGGRWELTSPVQDLADADAVTTMVTAIRDFHATRDDLVNGTPADYGLDRPDLTVTLTGPAGPRTVLLSRHNDTYYAMLKGEPAPMHVPADLFDALRRPPSDLRDRAPAHLNADDVVRVELAGPKGDVKLVRQQAGWQIEGAKPAPADSEIVTDLLDAVAAARAKSFVPDTPADHISSVVTLWDADGHTLAELHLDTSPSTGDVYATRPHYRTVLLLHKDARLAAAFAGRLALLDRTLLQAPSDNAAQIDLQNAAGTFRVVRKNGWRLSAPVSGPTDEDAVDAILTDFADLHAEGFAAAADPHPAAFGLDKPQATVTVFYRSTGAAAFAAHTLRIGSAIGAGAYATLDSDPRVCILPRSVVDHFYRNLASKVVCQSDDLTGLTLSAGGRTARFRYNAVAQVWTDASGVALRGIAGVAVRDAVALLADFRARSVADYVEKAPSLYGFDTPYLQVDLTERTTSGKRIVVGKQAPGGGRYVMGPATGYVLVANEADVARLRHMLEGTVTQATSSLSVPRRTRRAVPRTRKR